DAQRGGRSGAHGHLFRRRAADRRHHDRRARRRRARRITETGPRRQALDDVPRAVARLARPNDLVITLGAGSIGTLPDRILAALREEPSSVRSGKKLEAGGEADPSAEASGDGG